MELRFIEKPEKLLEIAFNKAWKDSLKGRPPKEKFLRIKNRALKKIDISTNYLTSKLDDMVYETKSFDNLHPFYRELVEETINVIEVRKNLSQVMKVSKIIKKLGRELRRKIQRIREDADAPKIASFLKQFFGRTASLVKSLEKSIESLNESRKKLREFPKINFDALTVILAGFPNTGKTTLLNKLTGSKAEINVYPFTTKSIKLGYFHHRFKEFQVIDTPGLLDREKEKRNAIERKAVHALSHLPQLIVFIFDPSETCSYSLEKQINLFNSLKKDFNAPFIAVANKKDVYSEKQFNELRKAVKEEIIETGEKVEDNLKETIIKKLYKAKEEAKKERKEAKEEKEFEENETEQEEEREEEKEEWPSG